MADEVIEGNAPPGGETPPTPAPVAPETPAPTVPLARFEAVSGEKWAERRAREASDARAATLEQQLNEANAKLRGGTTPAAAPVPAAPATPAQSIPSPADIQRIASQMADQQSFNKECTASVNLGRKEFPDFDASIAKLTAVAPAVDENGRPMLPVPTVQAALATGQAHKIFHHLAGDLNEADRIMSLPPMAQAVELAKLAQTLSVAPTEEDDDPTSAVAKEAAKARASGAPAPIKPKIGSGSAAAGKDASWNTIDKEGKPVLSTEEWMKSRQEEVNRNRQAGGVFGKRIA